MIILVVIFIVRYAGRFRWERCWLRETSGHADRGISRLSREFPVQTLVHGFVVAGRSIELTFLLFKSVGSAGGKEDTHTHTHTHTQTSWWRKLSFTSIMGKKLYYSIINVTILVAAGLRRGSSAAHLLGLLVRISQRECVFVSSECCVSVEVSSLGWSPVQSSPTECGVSDCDRFASTVARPWLTRGFFAMAKKISTIVHNDSDLSDFYTKPIYKHHN